MARLGWRDRGEPSAGSAVQEAKVPPNLAAALDGGPVGNAIEPKGAAEHGKSRSLSSIDNVPGDGVAGDRNGGKKHAGLVRMVGAPTIDLEEAKKQIMLEQAAGHTPPDAEMSELASSDEGGYGAGKDIEAFGNPDLVNTHDPEYLDTAQEETFTLDSFESLIRVARAANKAFILARVTTVDPKNLTRLYYSYYSAYQINKVIFRTQPDEGLLHRMRSRNPLNNMLIVGEVHYLAVTPEEFDRAWAMQQLQMEKRRVLKSSPQLKDEGDSENFSRGLLKDLLMRKSTTCGHRKSFSDVPLLASKGAASGGGSAIDLPSLAEVRTELTIREAESGSKSREAGGPIPVIYEAEFFATDDDFLMRAEMRDFFKKNAVTPEDHQLFQLHRRSDMPYELAVLGSDGLPITTGTNAASDGQVQSSWRTLGGLLDGGQHRSLVGLRLGYLSPLGFWISMLALTGGVVVIALLVLPAPAHYFAFAGLMVFFVITLLLFVDWRD